MARAEQIQTRSFFSVSQVDAGTRGLELTCVALLSPKEQAVLEMEGMGLELASIWDAGATR